MWRLTVIAIGAIAAIGVACGGSAGRSSATGAATPTSPSAVGLSATVTTTTNTIPPSGAGGDRVGTLAVVFPPRDQSFRFRQDLETFYRDTLRRPSSSSFVDIEGTVVWTQEYLRYRVNGCTHDEAVSRVLAQIDGGTNTAACSSASTPFPPRNEPFAFRQTLESKYRDGLRRTAVATFVDTEGDIVWTQEYLRYRTTGCGDTEASDRVRTQLQGGAPPSGCSTTTTSTTSVTTTSSSSVTTTSVPASIQASFVMRQGGAVVNACNLGGAGASNCSLDGTSSQGSITSYSWSTTWFRTTGGNVTQSYSGATPSLGSVTCTIQGNSQERFDVTLTVRNAAGASSTLTQTLSFARAGCGT